MLTGVGTQNRLALMPMVARSCSKMGKGVSCWTPQRVFWVYLQGWEPRTGSRGRPWWRGSAARC